VGKHEVVTGGVCFGLGVLTALALFLVTGGRVGDALNRILAERDGYQRAAVVASEYAAAQTARADSLAAVADSLRARRLSRPKTVATLPPLPAVCDTCVALLTQVTFERDVAIVEAETWREAWQASDLSVDSLKSALASSQKADSLGGEAVEVLVKERKRSLLAKLLPQPGLGAFAGACVLHSGSLQPCIGVGLTTSWRF